jgi:hypothetical protein
MDGTLHNVSDLREPVRLAVEGLVGHPLSNNQVIYVATLGTQAEPAAAERAAAWDAVEAALAQMQQSAARSQLTPEQIDELLDAECEAVRRGQGT